MTAAALPFDEVTLVDALRAGDEAAFAALVRIYSPSMQRLARSLVRNGAVADEVVQETWLGVLTGIGRFESRASVKTWIFRILTNIARTRAARERRISPFSALLDDAEGPTVAPDRFLGPGSGAAAGHWVSAPSRWQDQPEERLLTAETLDIIRRTVAALPDTQRAVISLRDVEGWEPEEVCETLGLTDGNQRILLHRARAKVRQALEDELPAGSPD